MPDMPPSLNFFFFLPLLVLALRAAVSVDPKWKRIAAAFVILFALAVPRLSYEQAAHLSAALIGSLYLFCWSIWTRDPRVHRIVSAVAALAGLVPLLFVFLLMSAGFTGH